MSIVILIGLGALGFAVYALVKHLAIPKWEAPAFAAAGVIVALLGAVGMGGRKSSAYRFDSSSSRALSTLGRMHDKK